MPRYVILEHDHPERHWDFMLETGDVLRTWKLLVEPTYGEPIPVQLSFDHRLIYLDYEGPVSGNRGSVVRWDSGNFTWQIDQKNHVSVHLQGTRLHGLVEIFAAASGEWYLKLTGMAIIHSS